jgi:hypothetical protein
MRAALFITATLLASPAAYAQSVHNNQHQTGSADSQTVVDVGQAGEVGATAIASGNVVTTAGADRDSSLDNAQQMDGETNAGADASVWEAEGNVAITSAAVANGATATNSNGDLSVDTRQGATNNVAATTSYSGGAAWGAGVSAAASANTAAVSAESGEVRLRGTQDSTGSVNAETHADLCCAGTVVSGAVASANNIAAGGYTTTMLANTTQHASGAVLAYSDVYADTAGEISGNATADGNGVAVDNQWGYVNARSEQNSSADVAAQSYVALGDDFASVASAGAYGVGNQANVSNTGSDTVMATDQNNAGNVYADAAVSGGADASLASSAAYGNSVSGSLCGHCDTNAPGLTVDNNQLNSGDVRAHSAVTGSRSDLVATTSTAIGNAATYQANGPS